MGILCETGRQRGEKASFRPYMGLNPTQPQGGGLADSGQDFIFLIFFLLFFSFFRAWHVAACRS
jgi:hypothetical protein